MTILHTRDDKDEIRIDQLALIHEAKMVKVFESGGAYIDVEVELPSTPIAHTPLFLGSGSVKRVSAVPLLKGGESDGSDSGDTDVDTDIDTDVEMDGSNVDIDTDGDKDLSLSEISVRMSDVRSRKGANVRPLS
eukprot:780736_1